MGHLYTDIVVKGVKSAKELKNVLIDSGDTYTVLPGNVLEEIGASLLPTEVVLELGNGTRVKAKAYGMVVSILGAEAPSIGITFEGAQSVVGVETLESIGIKLDPTTSRLEFTRPKGMAYFYSSRQVSSGVRTFVLTQEDNAGIPWGMRREVTPDATRLSIITK
ncbi:MAG: hypothetical protein HY707_11365 [Ignavibacteriae bacterium]|nr:hypothetical protein [Ignavibacteriota bacterium]